MKDNRQEALKTFENMQRLVIASNTVPYGERVGFLKSLRRSLMENRHQLQQALDRDFDGRSHQETLLADIMPTIATIDYSIRHLRKWMRGERKPVQIQFFPARNRIRLHPKGVVLVISPWNYPLSLSILPMASALAAGNRVILKPSELTPRTSSLLERIVMSALPADRARVFNGGPELSSMLTSLDFDHIIFTGSTRVGRAVMQAAASNLTPVTLELGGKSPAIVHGDFDLSLAAYRIARGKLINAGQTCIAPDYVLVQRQGIDEFAGRFREAVRHLYPEFSGNGDYSSIISPSHFRRLNTLLDDAEQKGGRVIALDAQGRRSSGNRKLHPHLVLDVSSRMQIVSEEIFGPILYVVPYDSLEEASDYVNRRPRPLALYYFDNDRARIRDFLGRTISGTAAVNDTVLQFVQESLPFGGVGASGMGVCHGYEGFRELSHARPVFYQAGINAGSMVYPPYGKLFERIMGFLLR